MPTTAFRFLLCFRARREGARTLVFPCDAGGRVELDGMSRPLLNDYLYARASVGIRYARPVVESTALPV